MTSRADYTRALAARFAPTPAPDNSARRESVKSGVDGMGWYDGSTKSTLAEKIWFACTQFWNKYAVNALTVYVNPAMLLDGKPVVIGGVQVLPSITVLPEHFFVSAKEISNE